HQIYLLMTWNGWGSTRRSEESDWATEMGYATTLIDSIHEAYPDCKVCLLGLNLPSRDGLAANYGDDASGGNLGNYHKCVRGVFALNKAYQTIATNPTYSGFVQFRDVCTRF